MSWVKQKATPNLKEAKAETMVALPSLESREHGKRSNTDIRYSWAKRRRPRPAKPLAFSSYYVHTVCNVQQNLRKYKPNGSVLE